MADLSTHHTNQASALLDDLYVRGISRQTLYCDQPFKTSDFLRQYLLPAASRRGISVVYCSFKSKPAKPQQVFLEELNLAMADAPIGISSATPATLIDQLELSESFRLWSSQLDKTPGLLIIEEIEYLASSAVFEGFLLQLRTLIDQAGSSICTLFTSSSKSELNKLFEDSKGALYHFSLTRDFQI